MDLDNTETTLLDLPLQSARSRTITRDDLPAISNTGQPDSSQANEPGPRTHTLEEVYPVLGPVLQPWQDALVLIGELPNTNYILSGAESTEVRTLCNQLPAMLDAFTQLVSRATGAFLDVKAVWRNLETETSFRAYSTITAAAQIHQSEADMQDSVARFVELLCNGIVWQGAPRPDWGDVAQRAGTNHPAVDPSRYPLGVDWARAMMEWPIETIDLFYSWQIYHQGRMIQGDSEAMTKVFQWLICGIGEPFQLEPGPGGLGIFTAHPTAYYLAMKKYRFRDDAYMPPSAKPRKWFTPDVMEALKLIMEQDLANLIHWTEVIEKRNPPEHALRDSDHPLFHQMNLHGASIPEFVEMFQVPKYVYDFTLLPHHDTYNLRALWTFVVTQNHLVLPEGVAGGETGVFRVVLCLLVISNLIVAVENGQLALRQTESLISHQYGNGKAITLIIQHLVSQLQASAESGSHPKIFAGTIDDEWRPEFIDLQMSGLDESLRMMWPYGLYGADLALGVSAQPQEEASTAPVDVLRQSSVIDLELPMPEKPPTPTLPPMPDLSNTTHHAPTLTTDVADIVRIHEVEAAPVITAQVAGNPPTEDSPMHTDPPSNVQLGEPHVPGRPKMKQPVAKDDSDDDVYALFKKKRPAPRSPSPRKAPATEKACPTPLPVDSDAPKAHRSLSVDPCPGAMGRATTVPPNVLGLQPHGEGLGELSFTHVVDESTPHVRSRSNAPRPLALSKAGSDGVSTARAGPSRPALSMLNTHLVPVGAAASAFRSTTASATGSPKPNIVSRSVSSMTRQAPGDDTATSSLLGWAAGALARSSPLASPLVLETTNDVGGSHTRGTPIASTKRLTCGALKHGHEGEGLSGAKLGKKHRSSSRATSGGEDDAA